MTNLDPLALIYFRKFNDIIWIDPHAIKELGIGILNG
jgi:hypothetical protein